VFSGCQEQQSDTSAMRKARLVADENFELTKLVAQRDEEIEQQKKLTAQCQQEKAKAQEEAGVTMLQMLQHLTESAKSVETLTEENAKLRERLAELEARLAEKRSH